jgi:membrane-bound lytic murein transglycosylase F
VWPNSTPEEHIRAAILYLSWLDDYWKERIFDDYERIHFILASYNAGLGHVKDAMNIALTLGYNPLKWEDNVAECMLLKSQPEYYTAENVKHGYCRGSEPYQYVRSIFTHYEHYKKVNS